MGKGFCFCFRLLLLLVLASQACCQSIDEIANLTAGLNEGGSSVAVFFSQAVIVSQTSLRSAYKENSCSGHLLFPHDSSSIFSMALHAGCSSSASYLALIHANSSMPEFRV